MTSTGQRPIPAFDRPSRLFAKNPLLWTALLLASGALCEAQSWSGDLTELTPEQLRAVKITSASLHDQSIEDAPASITVITAEEIRRYGYRTLAEALSWVRGFYATSDHSYANIGIRGFSLPGYETRYLVMINGHSVSENIIESTFVGNDFPLDLDLVDRIEIVRGPSSSLFGSNATLATINVITKRPRDAKQASVRIEAGSLRERKIEANARIAVGDNASLLASGSVFNNAGARELYFGEFDAPRDNFGRAIDMDGEKGYHLFANLTWGNWEALAVAGDRIKVQPFSWGDAIFNDRGTRVEDSRGFFELSYTKDLPRDRALTWRASYDAYRYRGVYRYRVGAEVEDDREHDYGDWVGSTLTYRLRNSRTGHLTLGADVRVDLRALQSAFVVNPEPSQLLRVNRRDVYAAVFAQQEWELSRRWEINIGSRFDRSWLKGNTASPRAAVIYKPRTGTNLKMMYGRGFRRPSSYDMFYDDGVTQIGNPSLAAETTNAYEVDLEHSFSTRLHGSASVYHYRVGNLVEQVFTPAALLQYVNAERVNSTGLSLELSLRLPAGAAIETNLDIQRSVFGGGAALPNSPGQVGKLRFSLPLWRDRLTFGAGVQAVGDRITYAGATLPWVVLPEVYLTTKPSAAGLQFGISMKNLSNSAYRDPAGLTPSVDSVAGAGRTFCISVVWRPTERPADSKRGNPPDPGRTR
jgi:outer membrane receptor for ferrienterochelin and colicins